MFNFKCKNNKILVLISLILLSVISFKTVIAEPPLTDSSASIGSILLEPEEGWKRIDDSNENITYLNPNLVPTESAGTYKDSVHWTEPKSGNLGMNYEFKFTGTKFRIISSFYYDRSSELKVYVDGVDKGSFSLNLNNINETPQLAYELTGLENKEHLVQVEVVKDGKVLLDAIDIGIDSSLSERLVFDIVSPKKEIYVNEEISINLEIDNISDIAAEDIRITYDSDKLEFINFQDETGIKLIYSDTTPGALRVILASDGFDNIVNGKKILLKLSFRGLSEGDALIDITRGRVSDGISLEYDVTSNLCGDETIKIIGFSDVNNSGEFTLLDLAIASRHLNKSADSEDVKEYNADLVVNNLIDTEDLTAIANQILINENYTMNK